MLKIFKYFKKIDWAQMVLLVGLVVVQVWFSIMLAEKMGELTNLLTPQGMKAYTNLVAEIWRRGGILLLYAVGSISCIVIVSFLSARLGASLAATLRQKIFYKIESFSLEELGGFSTPSLITRTTNDVQQVAMAVHMSLRFLVQAPVTVIWSVATIVGKSGELSWTIAGGVILLIIAIMTIFLLVVPKFGRLQKLIDRVNGVTRENLTGLRVVRAYNAEGYQEQKFGNANTELTKTHLFIDRAAGLLDPFITLIMNGVNLAIFWLGAHLFNIGSITNTGIMTEFMLLSTQIIMSFLFLTMIFVLIPRAMVSAKRINAVLDTSAKIIDGEGAEPCADNKGKVEFRNVSFKYPDAEEPVLHNISFSAAKGETVAFIGSTGSGKSTLIKLIPRFYDVTGGEVLFDGVDVRKYKQKQLRQRIGYVPQKGVLFSGSIRDNIAYGDTVADGGQIERAAQTARADGFIRERENGYDSHIAQGGKNVSGGQRQRLSIARAVARNPEVYIFDDSFSALDYKTDKEVRAALKENTAGATCLIVAQRIGTIINADKIIVLDKGAVVGEGTHAELLKDCKVYQEIAYSQLSKEELA